MENNMEAISTQGMFYSQMVQFMESYIFVCDQHRNDIFFILVLCAKVLLWLLTFDFEVDGFKKIVEYVHICVIAFKVQIQ